MKSTMAISVGVAVISGFLFICHFCTFVSCGLTCDEGCTLNDAQNECICTASVQQGKRSLISNQRTKRSACAHHHTVCTSTGDPHITTFKGTRWDTYEVGVFTMLRLDSRSLWIQTKHVSCSIGSRVSCICGVIAREGNSIIGITKCNEVDPLPIGYRLDTKTPPANFYNIPGGWRITLISGIKIEAIQWGGGQFMDVYVTGLASEVNDYKGLCDVREPRYSDCKEYNCGPLRVSDSESFFNINIPQGILPKCGRYLNPPTCGCYKFFPNKCKYPKSIPVKRVDIRSSVCQPSPKRENNDNYLEPEVVDRGLNLDYRSFDDVRSLNRREEFSAEDGRSRCSDALRLSPTYELCSGRVDTSAIVEKCAFDENAMKENGPAKSVPTELETACLDNIRLSLESATSSDASELKDLLTRVEKLVCPFQCSQNGKCVDSKCQCNEGFMGTDCSLRIGQAPVIAKILIPVCDIRKDPPCTQIELEASDIAIPENVVCKMRSVNDVDDTVPAVQTSTPVISAGLVVCNLPQMPVSIKESTNGKSSTIFHVQVSISNDGQTYSEELPFTVLDGNCMECPASPNTPCQLKENTCSIGGRCYKADESCPLDAAKICNPAKCTTRWTGESSANCDDGFENCT